MRRGRTQIIRCMLSHNLADLRIFTDGVLRETGDKCGGGGGGGG